MALVCLLQPNRTMPNHSDLSSVSSTASQQGIAVIVVNILNSHLKHCSENTNAATMSLHSNCSILSHYQVLLRKVTDFLSRKYGLCGDNLVVTSSKFNLWFKSQNGCNAMVTTFKRSVHPNHKKHIFTPNIDVRHGFGLIYSGFQIIQV